MTPAKVFFVILFSILGMAYFLYGKKQQQIVIMLCGGALMAMPYFVSATGWLLLWGVLLALVPFIADRFLA